MQLCPGILEAQFEGLPFFPQFLVFFFGPKAFFIQMGQGIIGEFQFVFQFLFFLLQLVKILQFFQEPAVLLLYLMVLPFEFAVFFLFLAAASSAS